MSLTDNELIELEEQYQIAPHVVDQSQAPALAVSLLSSSPIAPSPLLPDVSTPPVPPLSSAQIATPCAPLAVSGSHVEQLHPQPQHRNPGNIQQASPVPLNIEPREAQDSYIDPSDKFWSLYLSEADKEDAHLVESWKGDTEGILIFTGLFAATVATFVAQTYQLLTPSSDDASATILLHVSHQIAGLSNGTSVAAYVPTPFEAPFYTVWVNTLWFLSLVLSLTGALMATLMQQWTRRYLRGIRYRSAPHVRGPMHVALRLGIKKYKMKQAVTLITSVLHASVFIFFAGLIGFTFNLNTTVAGVLTAFISVLVVAYLFLSVLPMFSTVAPYDTVLTPAFQASVRLGRFLFVPIFSRLEGRETRPVSPRSTSREQELMLQVRKDDYLTIPRATYVLHRVLTNADEHHEVESFLDSMAVLLSDGLSTRSILVQDRILSMIFEQHYLSIKIYSLVQSCIGSHGNGVSPSTRIKRLRTIVAFMRHEAIQTVWRRFPIWPFGEFDYSPDPSISFLYRLLLICTRLGIDGRGIHHPDHRDVSAAIYGRYGEGIKAVAWPLFCFVELMCTILKFTTLDDSIGNPVAAYRYLWEPLLYDAKRYAITYLKKNLRENRDLDIKPIPHALLVEARIGDLAHSLYSSPALQSLDSHERLKIKRGFSTYPILVDALREVAGIVSLIPLDIILRQPDSEPGTPTARPSDRREFGQVISNPPQTMGSTFVLFGPLTWHNRPADEYQCLMNAWDNRFAYPYVTISACEVLKSHLKGEGYARICFEDKTDARKFVDAWMIDPPPAYWNVTAEITNDDDVNASGDGR